MLLLNIDSESSTPVYLQIRDGIVALVEDGTLRPGDRLPPTRALADTVGVHRSTIVRAYDEIRALGYLESRPGSYSTVRRRARPAATTVVRDRTVSGSLVDWLALSTDPVRQALQAEPAPVARDPADAPIDFERLAADPALAPAGDLRGCLRRALAGNEPAVLDYADPAGLPSLRETISTRLRSHGVAVSADEVLITSGAQHALDLILRLLTRPGDRIVVEAPTYGMAHALVRLHGLAAVEVPMLDDGIDLETLERVLDRSSAKLVYTMPNFHNPTGVTTDQAHRERLLAVCERHRVPLVEDGFQEEMKYFGKAVLPIKSIDARGLVLYVGTFSKVVFPGLRVGWIAAPREAIALLTTVQYASCLATNTLAQAAADRFSRRGEFEAYLRRIHRIYRRRMQTMQHGLERHLPPEVRWTRPVGGYTVWLTLAGRSDDERLWCKRLAAAGVSVAPGRQFFGEPPSRPHFRLSIACVGEEEIEEGCRRLGETVARR